MCKPGHLTRVITVAPGSLLTLKATCCFVEDGSWRVLIDPGAFENLDEINFALNSFNLSLADINAVYFTHLHFDHYRDFDWPDHIEAIFVPRIEWEFALGLSELANDRESYLAKLNETHEFIAPVFIRQFWRFAKDKRYHFSFPAIRSRLRLMDAGDILSPNVVTVNLPGHCPQLLALRIKTDIGIEMICADAILDEEDFVKKRNRLIVHDAEGEQISREIVSGVDIIHPGHGAAFSTKSGIASIQFAIPTERSL